MIPSQRLPAFLVGTAATLLLYFAAGALGPAGIFINLVIPTPAVMIHLAAGPLAGAGIVLTTAAVLVPVSGVEAALWYLLAFGLGSFLLPRLLLRGWAWDRAVAISLAWVLLGTLLAFAGHGMLQGQAPWDAIGEAIRAEVAKAMEIYRQADLPEEQLRELQSVAPAVTEFLVNCWPGLAALAAGALLLLQVALARTFSAVRDALDGPAFHRWKTPEFLVWPLILAGFGALLGGGLARTAGLNLLLMLLPVYFLQGLAVAAFFFRKKGISPLLRVLGYLVITLLNPFPLIVTGVGVFDLWVDFRKPRIKKEP